ncbi:iron(III) transport system permease protein [Halomicrobium zhouii]|uniref:Iron(III) transport system permease protein n=1 Tax=Halomicrobium zhouii TaxID=767519 RepID=A0A1I6KCW0_9EURY|nr:iron ABC transporter permease [Halomicrobium zhouii]SFR88710.1 iron(III) transport system permease protein [Halomicrobium zhouii]
MGAGSDRAGTTRDRLRGIARDDDGPSVALVLLAGGVAAAVLTPLLWLLLRASTIEPAEALSLLTSPTATDVLVNSLGLVAVVTAASVALGVPLAVLTVQTDLPFRRFWTVVVALPLVVPSYIGAFAYVSAFGPNGALADLLAPLGIPVPTVYGLGGTALVLTLFVYPYVFLTTRASLLSFDESQLEAARTLNHGYRAAFRRVILPQIAPGVTAGALLVALYTLSDFGTPAIMRFDVFTRVIYVELNSFGIGRANATLFSLELLAVTAVILALESRVGGDGGSGYGSPASANAVVPLGRYRWVAAALPALVATFTLVLPVGVLAMWLVRSGPGYAGGGLAFQPEFALNSVYVAALAALATVLFALPVAYYAGRSNTWLARAAERATYLGYAMPGVVLGLALVFFGIHYAPAVYQTLPLLVFAYVVRFLPQAVGSTRSSVLGVDPELIGAARVLGAPPRRAFRRVTLPLIAPGLLAGAALVFLTTMKELDTTLILHPTGFTTLVTYIWRVQEAGYYGRAALPALVLVVVSGLSMIPLLRQRGDDA